MKNFKQSKLINELKLKESALLKMDLYDQAYKIKQRIDKQT